MTKFFDLKADSVFLFDAFGALFSALASGLVLPNFSSVLGIEPWVFRSLAGIAICYMLYDLMIYFAVKRIRPWMLKTVILFNLVYCIVSAILISVLPEISVFGVATLVAEILVVITVVWVEYRVLRQMHVS